jgi:hypothetical protein
VAENSTTTRSGCGISDEYNLGKYDTAQRFERGQANDVRPLFQSRSQD